MCEAGINAMNEELPRIQEQVYYGQITSHTDVLEKFLSEGGYRRYNPQITGEGRNQKWFVPLSASILERESLLNEISYLHSPGTIDDLKPVTHLLVVNPKSKKGMKLLHEGIRYLMRGSKRARLGILFHANTVALSPTLLLEKVFDITASPKVLEFLDQVCSLYETTYISSLDAESSEPFVDKVCDLAEAYVLPFENYRKALSDSSLGAMKTHLDKQQSNSAISASVSNFVHRHLGIASDVTAVITNGRVILPAARRTFLSDDLGLLESVEFERRIKHVMEVIEEVELQEIDPDDLTRFVDLIDF
ncbi:hypothetical protein ACLOJK_023401 [Asimina triloba]